MKEVYLSSIDVGCYRKSFTLDSQYILKYRPWDSGLYNTKAELTPLVNMSYDNIGKKLTVYITITSGGFILNHFIDAKVKLFGVGNVGISEIGEATDSTPVDGVFTMEFDNIIVDLGKVIFVDIEVTDVYGGEVMNFRSVSAGV